MPREVAVEQKKEIHGLPLHLGSTRKVTNHVDDKIVLPYISQEMLKLCNSMPKGIYLQSNKSLSHQRSWKDCGGLTNEEVPSYMETFYF